MQVRNRVEGYWIELNPPAPAGSNYSQGIMQPVAYLVFLEVE